MSDNEDIDIYVLGNQVMQGDLGNGGERQCLTMRILTYMFWVTR